MDAIKLLKDQHRLVEKLFEQFEASDDDAEKHALFDEPTTWRYTPPSKSACSIRPSVRARRKRIWKRRTTSTSTPRRSSSMR
jgi:hypothetical protein